MNNYMKTIISGLKQWVSSQKSDWNQNDSSAANFIKNRPFYSEEKEKVLFSRNISAESLWDDVYGAEGLAYGLSFVVGQIYKITFDNVEYPCECKLLGSDKVFGNTMIVGEGEETEEPFFIGYYDDWGLCLYCLTEGTHSLSISGTVEEVHQIDKKYVPMPDLADVAHTGDYYDLQNTPYIPWDTVRYGTTQSLKEGNKKIARNNIGAAAATDVSSLSALIPSNLVDGSAKGSIRGINSRSESSNYSIGENSVALGGGTIASGNYSYAEGLATAASGIFSHAEGNTTTAFGQSSHAEGSTRGSSIKISGGENATTYQVTSELNLSYIKTGCRVSLISGGSGFAFVTSVDISKRTITLDKTLSETALSNALAQVHLGGLAFGDYSHIEGEGTIAGSDHQHVQGKYNIEDYNDKYAHIVGNGFFYTSRSNAHTLDWDGNAWFAGNIYVGGTGQDSAAAVKVAIVPFPTEADEGKILRVVNGAPTWVTLSSAEEASF